MSVERISVFTVSCALALVLVGHAGAQAPEPFETPVPADTAEELPAAPASGRRPADHGFQGVFAMPGPSLALSVDRETGSGFQLGAEASLVELTPELRWIGGYLDAQYAFSAEELRLSLGPEIGWAFLGLDAGYLLAAFGEHGAQHGLVVRPMLTGGIGALSFRFAWLFGDHADFSGEIGLLLKLPIELH